MPSFHPWWCCAKSRESHGGMGVLCEFYVVHSCLSLPPADPISRSRKSLQRNPREMQWKGERSGPQLVERMVATVEGCHFLGFYAKFCVNFHILCA